ncbi:MAG: hypothetical protein ACRD2L_05370, partial [Terriglobia bacterium]
RSSGPDRRSPKSEPESFDLLGDDPELGDGKRIIARKAQAPQAVTTLSAKERPDSSDSRSSGPDSRSPKSEPESFDLFVQFVDKLKEHSQ